MKQKENFTSGVPVSAFQVLPWFLRAHNLVENVEGLMVALRFSLV
jgi:hypothetical protein